MVYCACYVIVLGCYLVVLSSIVCYFVPPGEEEGLRFVEHLRCIIMSTHITKVISSLILRPPKRGVSKSDVIIVRNFPHANMCMIV